MISFQWITLLFLLVSGALFAYLIPLLTSHLRNYDADTWRRPVHHKQVDGSHQYSDH